MKALRIALLTYGVLVAAVFALLAGGSLYLRTEHARRFIKGRLDTMFPGSVTWGALRVSPFRGEIEIRDALVTGASGEELAAAERIHARLSYGSLFKREVRFSSLLIEKPKVLLHPGAEGSLTLVSAFVPESAPGETEQASVPFTLRADHFSISDGSLRFISGDGRLSLDAEGVRIEGRGNTGGIILETDLEAKGLFLSAPAGTAELGSVTLGSTLREGSAEIALFSARTGRSGIRASGKVSRPFDAPDFDLEIESSVDLQGLPELCSPGPGFGGLLQASMRVRGDPSNPELRLLLEYGGGLLFGAQVDAMRLELELEDRIANVKEAEGRAYGGGFLARGTVDMKNAFPDGFTSSGVSLDRVAYRFLAEGRGFALETMPGTAERVDGTAHAFVSVEGEGVMPETARADGMAEISLEKLSVPFTGQHTDLHARVDFGFSGGTLRITEHAYSAGGEDVRAQGTIDTATGFFEARVRLEVPDAGSALRVFGIEGLSGGAVLNAFTHGTPRKPEVNFSFEGRDLSFREIRFGDVLIDGLLSETGTVMIEEMTVKNGDSLVEGSGAIGVLREGFLLDPVIPLDMALGFHNVRIEDFYTQERVSGFFDGSVRLAGSFQSPGADLTAAASGLIVEGFSLGTWRFDLGYEEGTVHLRRVSMENNRSELQVAGEIRFPGDVPLAEALRREGFGALEVAIEVESDALHLEDFMEGMSGKIALSARIEGPLARPIGEASASGSGLDFGVQKLDRAGIAATMSGEGVSIDRFEISLADGEYLKGKGFIGFSKLFQFELDSNGISLSNLDVLSDLNGLNGRVRVTLSGNGSIEDPMMQGDVVLEDLIFEGKPADGFNFHFDLRNRTVLLTGESSPLARSVLRTLSAWPKRPYLPSTASRVGVQGVYKIDEGAFTADVSLENADLGPYFTIASIEPLEGSATGTIRVEGYTGARRAISGAARFSRIEVRTGGKDLISARDLGIFYGNGALSTEGRDVAVLGAGRVDVTGSVSAGGALEANLIGEVPFNAAGLFVPDLENAEGSVQLDARVTGTVGNPELEGNITLRDAGFTLPVLLQRVHRLNGRIEATRKRLTVRSIEGQLDGGRFTISGAIELEGNKLGRAAFELNANTLPVHVPDSVQLILSARLNIEGSPDHSVARGEVSLLEGLFYRDLKLNLFQGGSTGNVDGALPEISIELPYLRDMALDVAVNQRNPLVVDNNVAYLTIDPDLHVTGTLNRPIVTGRADIVSGTVNYGERTFTIRKGVIDFLSPYKIDPSFDIIGDTRIRDWLITLRITGKPENLDFTLSSDPPIEDADILSLLVTGKTASEFIKKEAIPTQSAATMLADIIASSIGKDIRKATGLDVLETETEIGDTQGSKEQEGKTKMTLERLKITLGKELTRRLKIEYSAEITAGVFTQRAEADYQVLENAYLKGFQDSVGRYGGAIQYRLDFR